MDSVQLRKFLWYASAVLSGVLIAVGTIFYLVLAHTENWLAVITMIGLLIVIARSVVRRRGLG